MGELDMTQITIFSSKTLGLHPRPWSQTGWERKNCDLLSLGNFAVDLTVADCAVVVTDHSWYDWAAIRRQARVVVDTRHAMA